MWGIDTDMRECQVQLLPKVLGDLPLKHVGNNVVFFGLMRLPGSDSI